MPRKKSKKKTPPRRAVALSETTPANLPAPQRVPKGRVGEVVQDFIDFGGANAVLTQQEDGETWLVRATA